MGGPSNQKPSMLAAIADSLMKEALKGRLATSIAAMVLVLSEAAVKFKLRVIEAVAAEGLSETAANPRA